MRDLIDERNFKEMCSRSIVKGYNVHYMTQEEIDAQKLAKQEKEAEKPKETRHRYKSKEKALDAALELYGMDPNDPVTREQIEQILGEREDSFMANLMSAVQDKEMQDREAPREDGEDMQFTEMFSAKEAIMEEGEYLSQEEEEASQAEENVEPIVIEEVVNV